jgi:short-subunit dehydrogenase
VDRTTLVTGATSGIGLSIVNRLVSRRHEVIALGRDFASLSEAESIVPVAIDLGDLDSLPASLQRLAGVYEAVDSLVLCAGFGRFGCLEEFSYAQIRELIDTNLVSSIMITRAFIAALKRSDRARIIFIGSEAALRGGRYGAVYAASKFGLRGFAQSLRYEMSTAGGQVTIINPGMVRTRFFDDLNFQPGDAGEEAIEPEDVARAVENVFDQRPGTVIDEINLSPLKHVVKKRTVSKT